MLLNDAPPDNLPPRELTGQPPFNLDHWRVEPARLSLSTTDGELRLEPRVMALLVTLARAEREVLSRAELLAAVWPDATVGDEALTMAVSKLRRALRRKSDDGPFIETIPRVGYRLLVVPSPTDCARSADREPAEGTAAVATTARFTDTGPDLMSVTSSEDPPRVDREPGWMNRGRRATSLLLPLASGLALMVAIVIKADRWKVSEAPRPLEKLASPTLHRAVTAYPGLESQATIDPTARRVAFQRKVGSRISLEVVDLESHEVLPVFEGKVHSPAWSPLDQRIAFIRRHTERFVLSIVPSAGGPVEDLLEINPSRLTGIGWSPDARYLAWSGRIAELETFAIKELDLGSGSVRQLTAPAAESLGDGRPSYSPDGRYIAFNRGTQRHLYSYDLWLLDRQSGGTRRLTHDEERIWGFDWLADSSGLVLSSNRTGRFQLWALPLEEAAEPVWIPTAGDQVRFPRVRGTTLVYDAFEVPADLFELSDDGTVSRLDVISSKGRDCAPAFSPDGSRLAFGSDRGANAEIWIREADGRARKLSRFGTSMIFFLAWSPDASRLAAQTVVKGRQTVKILDIRSGARRSLRVPPGLIVDGPVFAPDGNSVFIASDSSGRFEIWQLGLTADAEPAQVTDFGARAIRFGGDGTRFVLAGKHGDLLLRQDWGEAWRPVLRGFRPRTNYSWTVIGDMVHALHAGVDRELVWKRWSLGAGGAESLARVPPRLGNGGFAVHPDGRSAVVGRLLAMESDLRRTTLPPALGGP